MKKYQKPVLDTVEYEVEEILTVSGGTLIDGGHDDVGGDSVDLGNLWS